MNYKTKDNLIVAISVVAVIVSVLGLSIATTKITDQWLSLVFFLYGYSMFWWGVIDSRRGAVQSTYTRISSKFGEKRYLISIGISILVGIGIASKNRITGFFIIAIIHAAISVALLMGYESLTDYIEELPERTE